jgi:hypothetical protein
MAIAFKYYVAKDSWISFDSDPDALSKARAIFSERFPMKVVGVMAKGVSHLLCWLMVAWWLRWAEISGTGW